MEKINYKMRRLIMIALSLLVLASCKREFVAIEYGEEACSYCKMKIVDARYAAEIVDKKGKIFKFDDVVCLKHFMSEKSIPDQDQLLFVADFQNPTKDFLDATKAVYLHHDHFKSPMSGNYAAFASANEAKHILDSLRAEQQTWQNLK
jgi:copper chaperone NosL